MVRVEPPSAARPSTAQPYLLGEDICQPVDGVVPVAGRARPLPPALFEAGQKMTVKLQQVFQAREQTFQPSRVHLQVLLQLSGVDVQHDLQRSDVVHLCLHQLWESREEEEEGEEEA